ncbi:MAG: ABC transporter permease [Actinomycetota bacterium]|nr:ABC transporter permease [Actinomycetota bacterium]
MSRATSVAPRQRIFLAVGFCLSAVTASMLVGGIPLVLALGVVAVAVTISLPGAPRRYLLRRASSIVISVFVAMWFMWLLAHNYPDRSRLDEAGVVPAFERYIEWIGNLVGGDLGYSQYSESVWEGISRTMPLSLQLLLYSQIIALLVAVPGALVGARFRGRITDVIMRGAGLFGLAMPIIVIGPVLVYLFAVGELGVFGFEIGVSVLPAGRYIPFGDGIVEHAKSMALPSITLAATTAASYLVVLRSEVVGQLRQDHAQLALSKGLSGRAIVVRHGLRPAAPSMIALAAAQAAMVMGNMILVERIFTLPGFGDYVVVAIGRRDIDAVAGAVFVAATILAVVNLVSDALLLVVDPRIASEESQ